MTKSLLSRALIVAAVVGAAGVAQAQTFDSPQRAGEVSTMTNGRPNMLTNNIGWPGSPMPAPVLLTPSIVSAPIYDTTVLGGPPSVTTETVTIYPSTVYAQPSWGYYDMQPMTDSLGSATNTSRVPDRAGELSTIVNGVPNARP